MVGVLVGSWIGGLAVRPGTADSQLARWLLINAATVCAAFVAASMVDSALWIVPCYVAGGTANGAINVMAATLLGRRVPVVARGRAGTALSARTQSGALLGFIGGGLLLAVLEPRWIVLGCGILGLMTAIAVLPVLARASERANLPAVPERVAA
jgi:MFS family permease